MQRYSYMCNKALHMVSYTSQYQTKITEFNNLYSLELNPTNRWIQLGGLLRWDAYHESSDLIMQAQAYKTLYGYYPELILADKIYATNKNRAWCKNDNIRLSAYQKSKQKKEYGKRNQIEGKIGQAKQAFGLNQIKAKLKGTSETWIGLTLFVANIIRFV